MSRETFGWLEFAGQTSTQKFVTLASGVTHSHPTWRGTSKSPTGRSGDVFITDNTYDTLDLKISLRVRKSHMDEANAWLTGTGLLVFSWSPDRAYDARVQKKFDYSQLTPDADPLMQFDVTFTCQPFRYLYPGYPAQIFTQPGTLFNPGTVFSQPRVTIAGTGDFTVSIGGQTLYFTGIEDGIVVDSDLMDALTPDGLNLANDKMSGTPWQIAPGQNEVSWTIESGSVTSVTILPRWRYL